MARAYAVALVALLALAGASAAQAQQAKKCKTALDLIASQNMNLPLHPVFQNILNSEDLKGTIFIPTTKAWDQFFATMRQRQGNPAAPAMVTRYGQILLYHLAKDVAVPVADATPGANKFAVDTASTLQCTFGPGLPNNRLIIKKTPTAIIVQHGTGNATIVSQKINYCGGEAYLVDQVLNPCSDIAAVMGEIANIPSPCKTNVEGTLNRADLSYFNALLLATGVQRPIFSSVRNFTVFAPSNAAITNALRSGALNYPYLYANNATLLEGIVAYHAVPQYQFASPSRQTLNMKTLLTEGTGEAKCASPSLSWRPDGTVYGGTGSAKASAAAERGCNTQVRVIDEVLQPCCKPMAELLGGDSGLASTAPKGSIQEKAYMYLLAKVKRGAAGTSFVMPSAEAWTQFEADAAKQRVNLTDDKLDALFSYLLTTAPISTAALNAGTAVPMNLASSKKAAAALCPAGTKGTLVFAADQSAAPLAASSDVATAQRPAAAAAAPAYPAAAAAYPAGAYGRRLSQAADGDAEATDGAAATSNGLLLPTTFQQRPDPVSGGAVSFAAPAGPVLLMDGQEMELKAGLAIPVTSMTYSCDGAIYNVDAVPLPCNVLNRTAVKIEAPKLAPTAAEVLPAQAAANASLVTGVATPATSGAAAAGPLAASALSALLLAALLL